MEGKSRFGLAKLNFHSGSAWLSGGGVVGNDYVVIWGGLETRYNSGGTGDTIIAPSTGIFALYPTNNFRPGTAGTDTIIYFSSSLYAGTIPIGSPLSPNYDHGFIADPMTGSERAYAIGGRNPFGTAMSGTQWIDALLAEPTFGNFYLGPNMTTTRTWPSGGQVGAYIFTDFFLEQFTSFLAMGGGRDTGNATATNTFETYISSSAGLQQWIQHAMTYHHEGGAVGIFPDQSHALFAGGDLAFPANSGSETVTLQDGLYTSAPVVGTQPSARTQFAHGWDGSGRFWVIGGTLVSTNSGTTESWYFTPAALTWTQGPSLPATSSNGVFIASTILGSDEIMVIGGNANGAASNGFVLRYLAVSASWVALPPVLWTPRSRNHQAAMVTVSGNARPVVFGGEQKETTGSWIPDQRAREELIQVSQSIPFATTGSTATYTQFVGGLPYDFLTLTSLAGQTFHPIQEITLSTLSSSTGAQVSNYKVLSGVGGALNPASGSKIGYRVEKVGTQEQLTVWVPHGGIPNNTTIAVQAGNRAFPGWLAGPITNLTPEFASISPSASPQNPGVVYTIAGRWLDQSYQAYYYNTLAYGNSVRFTGSFFIPSQYSQAIFTPTYDQTANDNLGYPHYIKQNTNHFISITFNIGGSLSNVLTPFTWMTPNSGNLHHGADADAGNAPVLYFPFSESNGVHTIYDPTSVGPQHFALDSNWTASQGQNGIGNPLGNDMYFHGLSSFTTFWGPLTGSGTTYKINNWFSELRTALGSGNWSFEFWYYSISRGTGPSGLDDQFSGWFGRLAGSGFSSPFFPPYPTGVLAPIYAANDAIGNLSNGYLFTFGQGVNGPTAGQQNPYQTVSGPAYATNAPHTFNSVASWSTNNTLAQVGFNASNQMFVSWDVGPGYTFGGSTYYPNPVYVIFNGYTFPTKDDTWHHVHVDIYNNGANGTLTVDNNIKQTQGSIKVTGPNQTMNGGFNYPDNAKVYWPSVAGNPGDQSYLSLGPLRDINLCDLVIHPGTFAYIVPGGPTTHIQRIIDRRNGIVF